MNFSKRGSGSGRRGGREQRIPPALSSTQLPEPEISQLQFGSIDEAPLLADHLIDTITIKNAEYVASFNWKDARNPTIVIPGKPPRWQPPGTAQHLHEDGGMYYRDQNSARFPSYPIEPAIRAVHELVPDFEPSEIDVFGCGNTFGSLLSFARDEERTFRFGVELIGSSLFLVRKTNTPAELLDGVHGYGHTFPEAYTVWERDVSDSVSYQRVIKYDFAGLKCFIRSESDGYLPYLVSPSPETFSTKKEEDENPSIDVNQLSGLALKTQTPSTSHDLVCERAGDYVPQRALFDLKTRSLRSKKTVGISPEDFLHRLWVNQTPNFILAFHTRGKFEKDDIHIVDVRDRLVDWEVRNRTKLSKLGGLLQKLIGVASNHSRRRFEVRRLGNGPLQLWSETPDWSALPASLKAFYMKNDSDLPAKRETNTMEKFSSNTGGADTL